MTHKEFSNLISSKKYPLNLIPEIFLDPTKLLPNLLEAFPKRKHHFIHNIVNSQGNTTDINWQSEMLRHLTKWKLFTDLL